MNTAYTSRWIKQIFYLIFILTAAKSIAQSDVDFLPKLTPPSPAANELGKYGNVPVGMFTGAANISIQLISFKAKELESSMSLFYGSNGIKIDEVSTNVGLGWNLNFGGVITRTVRDKPDVQNSVYAPEDIDNATIEAKMQFYKTLTQGNADTERDLYSFNFNGNSGKFVYDKSGIPILTNHQKIKIERTGINNGDFLITTTDGVKYFFTEKESTLMQSTGSGHSAPNGGVTAWYLSKIVHPNGAEIYLAYENTSLDYVVSNSQTFTMPYPAFQASCSGPPQITTPNLSGIVSHTMSVIGKRISKIYSNNSIEGYVTFTYNTLGVNEDIAGNSKIETITQYNAAGVAIERIGFNYLSTANKRVFLRDISFLKPGKNYVFEYIDPLAFPERLSYSQDHWGYYNGKDNINLVPKNIPDYGLSDIDYNGANKEPDANFAKIGLLNKIIYPTKGSTEFSYESNTYWGKSTIYPTKTTEHYKRSEKDWDDEATIYTITSPVNQRIEITGYVTYVKNGPAPKDGENDPADTGHDIASLGLSCREATGNCPEFYTFTHFGVPYSSGGSFTFIPRTTNIFYFDAEAGKTYDLHFYKGGINTSATIDVSYYKTASTTVEANIETGGVRIKSTKENAEESGIVNYKRYYYAPKENLNQSSGDKGNNPFYIDFSVQRNMCTSEWSMGLCVYTDLKSLVLTSSSMISLFDTGNSNCFYKHVTVSDGGDDFENGGESKEFIVHRDYWGQTLLGDTDIQSAPWTNFGWDNGLEIKSQIFKRKIPGSSSFVVVAENENKYTLDPSYNKEVRSYSVRKNFEQLCQNSIDNFSIVAYKTISHWFYLETSISKKYDLNGLNPVETRTNYIYNNPVHLQLTSQTTKNSKHEILETQYFYPQDPEMASEPFVKELIAANRIATPLNTKTFRGGNKLSDQKTVYDKSIATSNLVLPKYILENKGAAALNPLTDKKISYDLYDDKGNILQYTQEGATPVAMIWGYNKTLPVAKIENMMYKNIPVSLINEVQTASSDKGSETSMVTAINKVTYNYNLGLDKTMMTTFIYKPLIGVSRITDEKGYNTYYDYDTFNRLKYIKDKDMNVLQTYYYNYKGQVIDFSLDVAPVYSSVLMAKSYDKTNCPSGKIGSMSYSVYAGMFTSLISQADADAKALAYLDYEGQAFANRSATCYFKNAEVSGLFTKNNCIPGATASPVLYTIPARKYSSTISQTDADDIAKMYLNKDGQAYANANSVCTFKNNAISKLFTKNDCEESAILPGPIAYIIAEGKHISTISQADADALALIDLNDNGQAYANASGSCIYKSSELTGSFNIFSEYLGFMKVAYLVPSGKFSSTISQFDADNQAQEGLSQCWQEFNYEVEQYQELAPNISPDKPSEFKEYNCNNIAFTVTPLSQETN